MSTIAKTWFDRLDAVLACEAELAGLLEHGSLIGSAREFFTRRVLRSILPPSAHIGSGRVISSIGDAQSKQVDVIVYDPRFPVLEVAPGVGLYPAEGVIAAIEVKSTLTSEKLRGALDNCASVVDLPVSTGDSGEMKQRCEAISVARKLPLPEARQLLNWCLTPSTYIFAFNSDIGYEAAAECVSNWNPDAELAGRFYPRLPRVIAAGGFVGLQNDSLINLRAGDNVSARATAKWGPSTRVVMGLWPTSVRFGFMASHILGRVVQRLGAFNWAEGIRYSLEDYVPFCAYYDEQLKGKDAQYVFAFDRGER